MALSTLMERDPRFKLALYWAFWKSLSAKLRQTNANLTQFFSETGKPPDAVPASGDERTAEFRVDLASKRKLFQEQKLSSMEINFLSSLSKERKYGPHQVIFREGEMGNEMYVVLEGRVMISKFIPGAGEEALAFLERGGYFGEMALIDNAARSADAKAHEGGAVVLVISREVLEGILDINKLSSIRLLTILCNLVASRLRELDEKIIGWFIIAGGSGISWPVPPPMQSAASARQHLPHQRRQRQAGAPGRIEKAGGHPFPHLPTPGELGAVDVDLQIAVGDAVPHAGDPGAHGPAAAIAARPGRTRGPPAQGCRCARG